MTIGTPNFRLSENLTISNGPHDLKILPAGSFVRPIELRYIPKHVLDDKRWASFNEDEEIFCYTRVGIIPIPRRILKGA